MTRKHFVAMAAIVRAILAGKHDASAASWVDSERYNGALIAGQNLTDIQGLDSRTYCAACDVANAFILLALQENARFNPARFLKACGLVD